MLLGAAAAMTLMVAVAVFAAAVHAQSQTQASRNTFEVASIKINTSGARGQNSVVPESGRLTMTSALVQDVIQAAYGIQSFELVTTDSSVLKQRIDIIAKTDQPVKSVLEMQQMLQPLLADRFKLVVHRETREMNALILTLANRDGRFGPKLKVTEGACDALLSGSNRLVQANAQPATNRPPCGVLPGGLGRIIARGIDIIALAGLLAPAQRRPVLDETGLKGRFDIDVTYTPEAFTASALAQRGSTAPPGVDPDGPSIFTALQDQLGIKMESRRAPVSVVVIDHIEPLSENRRRLQVDIKRIAVRIYE